MMNIAGYAIGESIHTGANLQQHRATRMVDKKTFTIKQLKSQHPSKEDVAKLYMEYDITSNISTGAVNRVLDIEVINNTPVIFEETLSAGTLKSWLHKNSMGVNDLIGFSIGLAESIDTVHRQQLVYNGICPDNLFWDPYLKTVQLTDFFLSSNIAVGAFMSLQDISSHLIHYISPEQTGRISSRVDARSDLYAIGALMYELLTGDSYIKADNIHDIIYQITCIEPAHPTSIVASTPAMLADIILKLLSKNSADRYQTAAGLIFDLKKCQAALSQEGEIPHFPLAQHDQLANIVISKDFCGRNEEVHILREAITRAAFGSSEVVLVAGEPGVGKTTLANEMAIPVIAMKGYFMSAKYQQLRSMKSYAIIKSLLKMLNGQLQVEGKDSILALKETLTEVLAADSVVILELLPEIKWLLPAGKTAAGVEKLDPIEAKIRFDRVIIDFFRVLAREAHPLTCYIDDIQWSDSASMELINKLMADASVKYITFIFGYRDNELAPNSPTLTRIESASQNPATTIKLLPFNEEQVKTLIATTVKLDHDSLAELSAIMMTKTLGNPFYIFEVLTEMAAHNVFSYHEASGYWRWDTQKVQAMNISANVVEFISKRLSVLSEFEIKVVKTMALMGVITDIPMLALLCDCSHKDLVKAIWKLVEIAVLVPLENTINTLHRSIDFVEDINSQQSSGLVRFSHDRSQQAAYDLDSESERKKRHLAIARTLFEHTPSQDLENKSTLIANQYNHALQLIDDSAEKMRIAQLNYFSGMLARTKNDFKSSLNFFATGIGALPDSAQTSQHPLPDQLAVELANAQYLCGDYLAAVASYDACIERTRDNDLMAEMVKSKVLCYQTVGMNEQALQAGINFLSTCQLHIPDVDDPATIEAMFDEGFKEYQRTVQTTGFNIGELSSHKTLSDPRVKRLTTVLSEIIYPAFFISMELMSLITLLQVNLILKHGNSEQSPFIYAWWGTTLAYRKHYDEADQYAQLATAMSRSNLQIARAYTTSGIFVYPYSRPLKHAVAMLKVAATSAEQTNQVALASYSTTSHNRYAFHSGLELESLKNESESCLESIARLQVPPIYDFHNLMHHSYLSLLGLSEDKYVLHENAETQQALLDKWTTDKSRLHMELYTLQEMILHYLYGDYAEAAHFAKLAEENKQGMIPAYDVTRIPFYYALSLLALYPNASGDEQKKHQKIIKNCTLELKTLTTGCEENFSHEYSLINAEQARIDGNVAAAITLYSEAITSAKENNFLNIEAMANELFAKFWLGLDQKAYANIHLRESYYLYQRWGAVTKLQQMEEAYGAAIKSINNEAENKADDWSNRDIDFDSILKSSREISQVSSLPKLINTVIHIMVKHIGAHNCCFLLKLNDSFIPATQLIYDSHNSSDFVYHTSPEFAHEVALPVADDHQAGEQPSVDDIRVPNSIIDYVTRSAHSLILGDLAQHSEFNSDPYFAAKKVMSIICQPIINKGEVIAVLYFENNALSGAFTERHENILNALSLQISISLENAMLLSSLEKTVATRTQELKVTMLKLVESEKLSSLGQMISGIAHELNTPIGVCVTSATLILEDTKLLNQILLNGSMTKDDLLDYINKANESINLLLDNIVRVNALIKIFKTTYIKNTVEKLEAFNVYEYLHEVTCSAKVSMDEQHHLTLDCDKNIEVEGYPISFALIINSLMANSLAHGASNGGALNIDISVVASEDSIDIIFKDDGCGIKPENISKVFDPFFTTNRLKGVGLGLHIVYNVVTQLFMGDIKCTSVVGEGTQFLITLPRNARDIATYRI